MPFADPGPIVTPRLIVRAVTPDDLQALLVVNGSDDVTRYLPYDTWRSLDNARTWYARIHTQQQAGTTRQFVIEDREAGVIVGSCLFHRYDAGSARAELGYVLGQAWWGRGIMREALGALVAAGFGAMGLRRIEAEVDPRNGPSVAVLQALGFSEEGLLRERWVTRDEPRDVLMFGLLRHEWPAGAAQD